VYCIQREGILCTAYRERDYCVLHTARGNTVYCMQRDGILCTAYSEREYCVLHTVRGNTVYCRQREGIKKVKVNVVREPEIDLLYTIHYTLSAQHKAFIYFVCSALNDA
jgi:hypothetical protein